jgi:CheY-like chemotaxis protein
MTPSNQASGALSILVVDDDPISRELVALLLGSEGHQVTKASSGKDALDAMEHAPDHEKPNAILVDLKMPGLSGGKLAERLRSCAGAGVRIFAMSASEPSSTTQFDGFLRKPIDTAALATLLGTGARTTAPAKPVAAGSHAVLDEAVFSKLKSMMPPQAVNEILDACIQDVRQKIPVMKGYLETGELKALRQAAHTIKGGSLMIGAGRISGITAKLEMGSYHPGEGLRFLKDLSSACEELEHILQERKSGRLW